MINKNGVNARCGRRGCKVVVLPCDGIPNPIDSNSIRSIVCIHRLSTGGTPTWKVLRWDIDEDAAQPSQAAG
jgi:hypothetical protein